MSRGGAFHVGVVGGGIAGVAAATALVERRLRVTLFEREPHLGGRAGAWTERASSGFAFEMERGFHAFFRQYYNLRALLRRIDPALSFLRPLSDYPILGDSGRTESFKDLPHRAPFNLITLTARTRTLTLRDLLAVNKRAALEMLRYDNVETYERFDLLSARHYLDSLRFPSEARAMLFDVFAHSFFNPEDGMSAAELLMMFHFYFLGNREGLVFDVCRRPFSHAIWNPFAAHLRRQGVDLRLGTPVETIRRRGEGGFTVTARGARVDVDALVLATDVPGLRTLVGASPSVGDGTFRDEVGSLSTTHPFAVWRLYLDKPTAPGRAPFAGTTQMGFLDNISLFHLFEDESRAWAQSHGGAVVELHAYAVPPGTDGDRLRVDLLRGLHRLYPETQGATVLHEVFLWSKDCPAFAPGSFSRRPQVGSRDPNVKLAGDFVSLPVPSALMERAATAGFMAANEILASRGEAPIPLESVDPRGLLARLPRGWISGRRSDRKAS